MMDALVARLHSKVEAERRDRWASQKVAQERLLASLVLDRRTYPGRQVMDGELVGLDGLVAADKKVILDTAVELSGVVGEFERLVGHCSYYLMRGLSIKIKVLLAAGCFLQAFPIASC